MTFDVCPIGNRMRTICIELQASNILEAISHLNHSTWVSPNTKCVLRILVGKVGWLQLVQLWVIRNVYKERKCSN